MDENVVKPKLKEVYVRHKKNVNIFRRKRNLFSYHVKIINLYFTILFNLSLSDIENYRGLKRSE